MPELCELESCLRENEPAQGAGLVLDPRSGAFGRESGASDEA